MADERSHMVREVSPIPPGRYWICVLGKEKQADFASWVQDMRGAVQIESASLNDEEPSTEFVIFRVPDGRYPFLNSWEFGFPNTAPAWVTSLQDVEKTVEPEPDPLWGGFKLPSLGIDSKLILAALAFLLLAKR